MREGKSPLRYVGRQIYESVPEFSAGPLFGFLI